MAWLKRQGPVMLIHVLALLPAAWLVADFLLDRLSADPIQDIQIRTGRYAITILVISLAGTPLYRLSGLGWFRTLRRIAGLYAFAYAGLHLLNYLWLDYGFNTTYLGQDLLEKRYAIAGLASFILLIPVAVTSTSGWQRRLGRDWKIVHGLVYPAALLAGVHYIWQAKIDTRLPIIITAIIAALLLVRLPFISRLLRSRRERDSR